MRRDDRAVKVTRWTVAQCVAAAMVLVVALAAWRLTVAAGRSLSRTAHWEAVAGGVQADIAVGHVWLEEYLAGDRTIDVNRDILGNFDSARARTPGAAGWRPEPRRRTRRRRRRSPAARRGGRGEPAPRRPASADRAAAGPPDRGRQPGGSALRRPLPGGAGAGRAAAPAHPRAERVAGGPAEAHRDRRHPRARRVAAPRRGGHPRRPARRRAIRARARGGPRVGGRGHPGRRRRRADPLRQRDRRGAPGVAVGRARPGGRSPTCAPPTHRPPHPIGSSSARTAAPASCCAGTARAFRSSTRRRRPRPAGDGPPSS